MRQFTDAERREAFFRLSPAEKEATFSEAIYRRRRKIEKRYRLRPEDCQKLKFCIAWYLVQLVDEQGLREAIAWRFGDYPADKISNDVINQVLPEFHSAIKRAVNKGLSTIPTPRPEKEKSVENTTGCLVMFLLAIILALGSVASLV